MSISANYFLSSTQRRVSRPFSVNYIRVLFRFRLRRRWLLRNGRPKVRVTEKARTNVVRKSSQNHLEEARKLLAELGMTKDEKLLAATQKSSSRKFLLDKPPFKSVR